jgi:arylsulfatase
VPNYLLLIFCLAALPSLSFAADKIKPADGSVLPYPAAPFGGQVGLSPAQSKPQFPQQVQAPAGAPNILLVLTDDVGFAASSTFGGAIPTPNLDRLAANGLRFNHFHTTAMCSPTRAALLTGRNHHAVASGTVADMSTGYPGYNGEIPRSAATLAQILRLNGYSTAMFGKHHNMPYEQMSAAGPFDLWPTGLGFEYFYGFIGGDTDQWQPKLYRGTAPLDTKAEMRGDLLDKVLADDAMHWLHNQKAAAPDKPFFMYYAPGSAHAPHQAPAEWIAKFSGRFDMGWDKLRETIFAQQKAQGIIPAAAGGDSGVGFAERGTAARQRADDGSIRGDARVSGCAGRPHAR